MATQKILLPYNFTSFDQKALDFVINFFGKSEDIEQLVSLSEDIIAGSLCGLGKSAVFERYVEFQ